MTNILLNGSELSKVLARMDKCPNQNIMLVGKHGIGKSEILTNYYQSKGMKVVPFFLGQMSDPGDLIGLPKLNEETGRTEFMPPMWFPQDNEPIVLFLDELNRARPEILQVIMDLCLNKKLAGRTLPAGSRIIAAVNGGQEYNVTDLDPALVSRFNIYNFAPTTDEWLDWGARNNLDKRVLGFLTNTPQMVDGQGITSQGLDKTPDRRGWKKVSDYCHDVEEIEDFDIKIIGGMIGVAGAAAFSAWLKEKHLPSAEDVLLRFTKTKKQLVVLHQHELAELNDQVCQYVDAHADNVMLAKGLHAYVKFLSELGEKGKEGLNKSSDAIHNFASLFMSDDGKYEHMSSYIVEHCEEVLALLRSSI